MKDNLWIFILALATCPLFECNKTDLRTVNPMRQAAEKYPFIVALVDSYKNYLIRVCAGTLIRSEFVLTAGHCFSRNLQFVQYGEMSKSPSQTKMKRRILTMLKHPNYFKTKKHLWLHDIGLLRIDIVHVKGFGELAGKNYILTTNHPVNLAGYGRSARENTTLEVRNTRPLLTSEGMLIECFDDIRQKIPSNLYMNYLCVNPKPYSHSGHYVMSGDGGGPLLYNGKVVGVASQIYTKRYISVYTATIPHMTWIRQVAFHGQTNN